MNRNNLLIFSLLVLASCSAKIPSNQDDICDILDENPKWEQDLLEAQKRTQLTAKSGLFGL